MSLKFSIKDTAFIAVTEADAKAALDAMRRYIDRAIEFKHIPDIHYAIGSVGALHLCGLVSADDYTGFISCLMGLLP